MEFRRLRWKMFDEILSCIGTWNSMDFYENTFMEFYGVPQKLHSIETVLVFHEKVSMECHQKLVNKLVEGCKSTLYTYT